MKRPGKFVTNATLAICGSSMLFASCDGFFVDNDMICASQVPDIGNASINIELNQENQNYIMFLNKLSIDIINQPKIAQEFAENPQKYIEKYGYNEKIDLDENMLNYILTLGNKDIQIAIKQNDIETIIRLMREKCLVTNNFTKFKLTSENITQLCNFYGLSKQNLPHTTNIQIADNDKVESIIAVFAAVVWIFVVVIEDAVAAYNVGVGLNAAAYTSVYYKAAAWGPKKTLRSGTTEKIAIETNLSFKAISAKAPEYNEYFLASSYIEDFSTQIVDAIEKEVPEALYGLNKEDVRNLVKYNMYLKTQQPE